MELRQYGTILLRRWPLAVIPALIVLALGMLSYRPAPPAYNVGVRFVVGQPPLQDAPLTDEGRYYNWLSSEYVVNGLTDWVRGGRFSEAVSARLAAGGLDVPSGIIQGGLAVDNARSMLTLSLTTGDAETARQFMDAAILVLTEENASALPQLGGQAAVLTQLDSPIVNPIASGLRSQLDLPLRVGLALAAGVGLALLAHYLDPTFRDRLELERLGLPVIGEIPGDRRKSS